MARARSCHMGDDKQLPRFISSPPESDCGSPVLPPNSFSEKRAAPDMMPAVQCAFPSGATEIIIAFDKIYKANHHLHQIVL